MNGSYNDSNWTEQVTIPVKRVGDRWEFFYGGDVPVREGALGHLTVGCAQITDKAFLERLQRPAVVKVLPEGAPLLVALSDRLERNMPQNFVERMSRKDVPVETTRLEQVFLGPRRTGVRLSEDEAVPIDTSGGLWLRVKGLDKTELVSSTVLMPTVCAEPTAISLNHALTMLSERFEKHRISHTGNVYTRVFYMESDGGWYPLADLREGVLVSAERKLMAESWQALEQKLGWRPVVRPGKKKGSK